ETKSRVHKLLLEAVSILHCCLSVSRLGRFLMGWTWWKRRGDQGSLRPSSQTLRTFARSWKPSSAKVEKLDTWGCLGWYQRCFFGSGSKTEDITSEDITSHQTSDGSPIDPLPFFHLFFSSGRGRTGIIGRAPEESVYEEKESHRCIQSTNGSQAAP